MGEFSVSCVGAGAGFVLLGAFALGSGESQKAGLVWARESVSPVVGVYSSVGSVPALEWKRASRA